MKISKSAIFIFELMIIIFVFTIASAVCVRIFVSSYDMSQESRALTMGSIGCQTIAEELKTTGKDANLDSLALYYDKDWKQIDKTDAKDLYYSVIPKEKNGSGADGLLSWEVFAYSKDSDKPYYSVTVERYEP